MNEFQKTIVKKFIIVLTLTLIAVIAMINFKDWINRSEAMRAMENLGRIVIQYRKDRGSVPSESYIATIKKDLEGHARIGNLRYRALWIDSNSDPNEILAYSKHQRRSFFFGNKRLVLKLDGTATWMPPEEFKKLLSSQQSPEEIQTQEQFP